MSEKKERFPKPSDKEQPAPAIEISLDKSRYRVLTKRVDADGEIYLERAEPRTLAVTQSAPPQRKYHLRKRAEPINVSLDIFPHKTAVLFEQKLVSGERFLWRKVTTNARMAKITAAIMAVFTIWFLIDTPVNWNGFLVFSGIEVAFLLIVMLVKNCYAITNRRIFFYGNGTINNDDNAGLQLYAIPLKQVTRVRVKRHRSKKATVVFTVLNKTGTLDYTMQNVSDPDELLKLLESINLIKRGN